MTPKKILFIILAIVAGVTIISLSSCSNKFYARQCAKRFPVIESTHDTVTQVVGKTDTLMQSVTIDCDSAIKYLHDTTHTAHMIKVPCPPSYYRVDTFRSVSTIIRKDSAGNYLIQSELSQLRQKTAIQAEKITKQARIIRNFIVWTGLFGLFILIMLFLKLYLKIKI